MVPKYLCLLKWNPSIPTSCTIRNIYLIRQIPLYLIITDNVNTNNCLIRCIFLLPGADPGFQVRWGALIKIAPRGGRRENVGLFRVKNHDFTPKNHIFSNFRGGWGARRVRPLDPPLITVVVYDSNMIHDILHNSLSIIIHHLNT